MEKQMLKAADVAEVLGCSVNYAYRLIQLGHIPSVRLNRAVRVPRPALEKWLEQQSAAALANAGGRSDAHS